MVMVGLLYKYSGVVYYEYMVRVSMRTIIGSIGTLTRELDECIK